jgi:prepilin peptidase CpaA
MSISYFNEAKLILLAVMLVAAVYTDMKYGKIYNSLIFPCMLAGFALNTITDGFHGLLVSLGGVGLIFGLFLIAAPAAGVGGGDVKLMMAVGAITGFMITVWAVLFTAVAGGLLALIVMMRHRALASTTSQIASNIYTSFLLRTPVELTNGSSRMKFRYSPAIALGTVLAIWLKMF